VSEDIVIPPKHYNSLIGAGGKLIHAIMEECGGVTIKFPPAESNSDKVTIRGPKEDVEKAKQQLLELSTERQLSGFSAEVRAKPQHHKFLIGRNGVNIKKVIIQAIHCCADIHSTYSPDPRFYWCSYHVPNG